MKQGKFHITLDASDLKLLRHPRKEMMVKASEIQGKNADFSKLFPAEAKPDITYLQGISFTIGNINANDCLIVPEEGIESYKSIPETPIDVEHERDQIVGFALKSFLCNIKNNKILSEDEALEIFDAKGMVNVGMVFGIWRLNHPELDDLIHESFDAHSEYFDSVKLSFEYYFDDYDYFISDGRANYPNGKIVSGDPAKNPDAEEMYKALRIYVGENGARGSGLWEGNRISIVPRDGWVGGNAVTFRPANVYSDLIAKKNGSSVVTIQDKKKPIQAENVKTSDILSVNTNEVQNMNGKTTDTKTSTTEASATAAAPVVTAPVPAPEAAATTVATAAVANPATAPKIGVDPDVASALQNSLDKKIAELGTKDQEINDLKAAVAKAQKAAEDAQALSTQIQSKYDEAMTKLNQIEAERVAEAKKAKLADRMAQLDKVIKVTDENRAILESEAASLSDEDFAKKVELYGKLAATKTVEASTQTADPAPSVKTAVQEVVKQAAEATPKVEIPGAAAPVKTLAEQYQEAFGKPEAFGLKFK